VPELNSEPVMSHLERGRAFVVVEERRELLDGDMETWRHRWREAERESMHRDLIV